MFLIKNGLDQVIESAPTAAEADTQIQETRYEDAYDDPEFGNNDESSAFWYFQFAFAVQ